MDLGLKDRGVLVVGGSENLGFSISKAFVVEGARVAIAARRADGLAEAARAMADATGVEPLLITADVTVAEDVERMAEEAMGHLGRIHVLVNNAGQSHLGAFLDLSEEDWDANLAVNLRGVIRCCRSVVPHMIEAGGGSIINIGSVSGLQPSENAIVSNTAKAAMNNFSKSLSNELAPKGVRVNCVNPGRLMNDRWRARAEAACQKEGITEEEFFGRISKAVPLGRFAEPEELAPIVVFLASDQAGYFTGQSVYADGGMIKSAF